jgi:twinkle protein
VTDPDNDAERYRFIWRSRALLDRVGSFILAVDDDGPGRALRADLARRLGPERCMFVTYPDGCKDLNEVLKCHNEVEVARTLNAARPYPIKGIYRLADFPEAPPLQEHSLGLPACDTALPLVIGTLAVWTGFAGAGKTSLMMFLIANLLRSGINVALGSFETMPKPILDRKLKEALCRSWHGGEGFTDLMAWAEGILNRRFTVVAQASDDPDHELTLDETLELARISVLRDGVRLFIVDPWNELEHKRRPDESELAYTSRAIRAWKAFGRTYQCAVWIVAHPKKPGEFGKAGSAPGLYDISGSADWANKADYGVVIHRPDKKSTITELTISKVRMGLPGHERTIKLDWQWRTASYADGGNE